MKIFASCRSTSVAVALAALVAASDVSAATLSGVVTANGRALDSAVVSMYYLNAVNRKFVTVTNAAGTYRFTNVLNGRHVIIVEKDGRRIYQGVWTIQSDPSRFDIAL